MDYSYRHCGAPDDYVFTQAVFAGELGDPAAIAAEMGKITESREATQPIKSRTGGSTFKNPPGHKAWQLIDAAGCRGLRLGGAQVSEMHCNFLINLGHATAADIEALGETVRQRVKDNSGIDLEWEIKRIGVPASARLRLGDGVFADQVAFLQPRIDRQRAFERHLRFRDLALLHQDNAFAGKRGVMHRLERKNMLDGVERSIVLAGEKIDIAELIPAFGELRRVLDQRRHVNDGFVIVETQLRLSRLLEQLFQFVVGKAAPERPEAIFGLARLGVALGRGEFGKERGSFLGLTLAETDSGR